MKVPKSCPNKVKLIDPDCGLLKTKDWLKIGRSKDRKKLYEVSLSRAVTAIDTDPCIPELILHVASVSDIQSDTSHVLPSKRIRAQNM